MSQPPPYPYPQPIGFDPADPGDKRYRWGPVDRQVRLAVKAGLDPILDIVDAHTNRLIWRGWAQSSVGDILKNRDQMARRIDEAVTRMFARFPIPLS